MRLGHNLNVDQIWQIRNLVQDAVNKERAEQWKTRSRFLPVKLYVGRPTMVRPYRDPNIRKPIDVVTPKTLHTGTAVKPIELPRCPNCHLDAAGFNDKGKLVGVPWRQCTGGTSGDCPMRQKEP